MSSRKFLGTSKSRNIDRPRQSPIVIRVIRVVFWSSLRLSGVISSSYMGRLTRFARSSLRVVSRRCSHNVVLVVTWYGPHHQPWYAFDPANCSCLSMSLHGSSVMSCRVITRQPRVETGVVWLIFLELLVHVSKQRDSCLLLKVLCNQSHRTYSYVMLWVHKNRFIGFVHCVGALLSLISFVAFATCRCATKGHPGSQSCKQGQYIHGNVSKVPFAGCLLVTRGSTSHIPTQK